MTWTTPPAWPLAIPSDPDETDRLRTYAAMMQIRNADLNALQDAMIGLYREHDLIVVDAKTTHTAGAPDWERVIANPEVGWEKMAVGSLIFDLQLRQDVILKSLFVKYYNALGTPAHPTAALYLVDTKFGTAATAPALGSAVGAFDVTDIAGTAWDVRGWTFTPDPVVGHNTRLMVVLSAGTTGDRVAGLKLGLIPLTPAPTTT